MSSIDESYRQRARSAIIAARRGHLPKPEPSSSSAITSLSGGKNVFETARENSIEVYDDKFGRNSVLTRSARIRKFKFYQYKPIHDTNSRSPQTPAPAVLLPRDDVLQGNVALVTKQSEELSELDDKIAELERKIADLNTNNNNNNTSGNNLDEIFDLVNQKNDLLRRQMQLNIIEQEKVLEKANEELTKELRSLLSIEDNKKSQAELERQQHLYDQSLALVNKRNELVLHMDVQEKGIEEDNALKATLKTARDRMNGQNKRDCCIQ